MMERQEVTKNGAEPGCSRTRTSHQKALQTALEGVDALPRLTKTWLRGLAARSEAQLWLKADILPLVKEIRNAIRTAKTKHWDR